MGEVAGAYGDKPARLIEKRRFRVDYTLDLFSFILGRSCRSICLHEFLKFIFGINA